MSAPLRLKTALWRLGWSVRDRLAAAPPGHPIHAAARTLRSVAPVRAIWKRYVFKPDTVAIGVRGYAEAGGVFRDARVPVPELKPVGPELEEALAAVVQRARVYEEPYEPVPNSALIVNCGLSAGGAERQILNTLAGLQKRGVHVAFLGEYIDRAEGLDFHLEAVPAGVEVACPRKVAELGLRMYAAATRPVAEALERLPEWMVFEILDMVEEIRRRKPAAVHLWQDQTSIKHGLAAVIAGVPRVVLSGRNVNPTYFLYDQPYLRPGYRALVEHPSVLLTNNSEAGVDSYAEWSGIEATRFRVIRNGVSFAGVPELDVEERRALRTEMGVGDKEVLVGAAMRLAGEKRPLLWLETAAILAARRPEVRFAIAGDGPLADETRARAESLGMASRLVLLGERADVHRLMQAFDLFLMTSSVEGTPNALLEAQWFGRPVVTTAAGGAPEAVDPDRTGLVVENTEPEAIAAAAERILADPAWLERARLNGRAFVQDRFGVERMIDETMHAYFGPL